MRRINIYVAGDVRYMKWIDNARLVFDMNEADIVMLTGGADVDPALYGQYPIAGTMVNKDRDSRDSEICIKAFSKGIPVVGICRGLIMAQL